MNSNQRKIYDFLQKHGESSKKDIALECMGSYYTNGMFHFGLIMRRMVDAGYIERTRKGYYKASEIKKKSKTIPGQLNLEI